MRILQVTSYFTPHVGGIESHVLRLSRCLSKEGHEVTVLTTNIPRSRGKEEIDGIEVFRFEAPLRPMGNPLAIGMLKGLLSRRDFDIIHTHDEHAFTTNLAALTRHMGHRPLIVSCHGRLAYNMPFEKGILNVYEKTLMLATLRSAEAVISLSESDKLYLSALGVDGDKIFVIPNAVDIPEKALSTGGGRGERIILCVSQLLQRKGVEILVEAMHEVHRAHRNVKLLIVGEGERKDELLKLRSRRGLEGVVVLKERASRDELEDAYVACDLLVLPSFAEGMPTVILEAMARGKPVIATDIPGVRDYFNETALLVPPGDHKKLGEAILRLLGDEELRRRLGQGGRNLVERRFNWDIVARQIIDLYEHVFYH
ncbi:MAG: glycosyltransferase family 4 protein [Thermoproteota archaeon]